MTRETAIEVLEIMKSQLKDFGMTSEFNGVMEMQKSAIDIAIKSLKEIQKYRAIGTVEECLEAMERQRAKKPIDEYIHCISRVHQGNCPVCGNHVYADLCNITPMKYCQYCGQAIDWSDID